MLFGEHHRFNIMVIVRDANQLSVLSLGKVLPPIVFECETVSEAINFCVSLEKKEEKK